MLNVRDENLFAVRFPSCQTGMSPHLIEAHWSLKLVLKVDCAFAARNFQIGSRSNMSLGEHLSDKCAAFERSKEHTRLACQHGDSLDKVLTDAWKRSSDVGQRQRKEVLRGIPAIFENVRFHCSSQGSASQYRISRSVWRHYSGLYPRGRAPVRVASGI